MLCIKNAFLMDPYTNFSGKMDILIDDNGIIAQIDAQIDADCPVFDAQGATVTSGLIDTHVHFRDPGQTAKEDLHTGMAAAAAGGFTTVICMANTVPTVDCVAVVDDVHARAAGGPCEVLQASAITKGLQGEEMTDFAALLAHGTPCFTDDGINLTDTTLAERAMHEAVAHDTLLSFHEEAPAYVDSPGVNAGSPAAAHFGVPGASHVAEDMMVERDIALAEKTGARVLFQHLSSAKTVDLLREAKKNGVKVYGEVTPHHLALNQDAVLEHGTYARMNPPLRTEADRLALIAGLCDGTLDVIATDHAPHTTAEKARPFAKAPSGITGLETAFSVCNTALVETGMLTRMQLLEKMSKNPAEIYRLENRAVKVGNFARLCVLDWQKATVYTSYRSKSENSPFTGKPLVGTPVATICGCMVHQK